MGKVVIPREAFIQETSIKDDANQLLLMVLKKHGVPVDGLLWLRFDPNFEYNITKDVNGDIIVSFKKIVYTIH